MEKQFIGKKENVVYPRKIEKLGVEMFLLTEIYAMLGHEFRPIIWLSSPHGKKIIDFRITIGINLLISSSNTI